MVEVVRINELVLNRWLAAWSHRDPFSDTAVLALQELIKANHFIVAMTLPKCRQPFSLVFRTLRTLQPAGQRFRLEVTADATLHSFRFPKRPIDLQPFTDRPIILKQGQSPCTFQEALQSARDHAIWAKCPVIYAFDGAFLGQA
ncbi:hypothetical protein I6F15_12205 [Bradyrhizobium sp. BRP14]|nr:hypothetical protein [Bradyrhizobium sp. BRP14]